MTHEEIGAGGAQDLSSQTERLGVQPQGKTQEPKTPATRASARAPSKGGPAGEPGSAYSARLRRALKRAGVVVHWPSGEPVSKSDRKPMKVAGTPLSEQIVADRR